MLEKPDPRPPWWSIVLPVAGLLLLLAPATLTGSGPGIALVSAAATLLFMLLAWWVNRRTQAWRATPA